MASTGKCPFCGAVISSEERICPSCGAENQGFVADSPRRILNPRTIQELKEYCAERGMPLLRMRFFVGENYKEPKAFGIYQDGTDFVVYKNKADGSRAIRYRGPDEAHAVHELHAKLLSECHMRGIYPDGKPAATRSTPTARKPMSPKKRRIVWCAVLAFFVVLIVGIWYSNLKPEVGYYRLSDKTYYAYSKYSFRDEVTWYVYDGKGWIAAEQPAGKLSTCFAYQKKVYQPAWGGIRFPLRNDWDKGYYLYQDEYYYHNGKSYSKPWYKWNVNSLLYDHWYNTYFPETGKDGYLVVPGDYYIGEEKPEDWTCEAFGGKPGYYAARTYSYLKNDPQLYYCTEDHQWYSYKEGTVNYYSYLKKYSTGYRWVSESIETPDDRMQFLGTEYKTEYGGCAFGTQEGYYAYGDDLYYVKDSTLFKQESRGWFAVSSPVDDLSDYYVGDSFADSWSGSSFRDTREESALVTYQQDVREAQEQREREAENSKRYSSWSSSDYDSWDSSDTDWDSDW
ncbi:MAG: zinc ribbon domain-containing protein [Clostridia bacterium]|nr:zinc ribbon domain-containing protein [Clostridia bacterium]